MSRREPQEILPPRGSRKRASGATQPFVEPARARRRGRALETELDAPEPRADGADARGADAHGPRRREALAGAKPRVAKANRRVRVDSTGSRAI
jgi:hypothetical protein